MSKGLEVNIEIGLCAKDMAKENPIKDFEILIEEHKDKWSKQMYDYFKECLNEIKKKEKALEIIKGFKKDKYSKMEIDGNDIIMDVYLTLDDDEIDLLKEVLLCQRRN